MDEEPVYKIHASWFLNPPELCDPAVATRRNMVLQQASYVLATQSQLACAVEAVVQEIMEGLVLPETP